jgi:hypothetical protein
MSPVAADRPSADSAAGEPAVLLAAADPPAAPAPAGAEPWLEDPHPDAIAETATSAAAPSLRGKRTPRGWRDRLTIS